MNVYRWGRREDGKVEAGNVAERGGDIYGEKYKVTKVDLIELATSVVARNGGRRLPRSS